MTPATLAQIDLLRVCWTSGLPEWPGTTGKYALTCRRPDHDVMAVKFQQVDVSLAQARLVGLQNRVLIALAMKGYLAHGHRGLIMPCPYTRRKDGDRAETGPPQPSLDSSGSGALETVQHRRLVIKFTQHGIEVSDGQQLMNLRGDVQQLQAAAFPRGTGVGADDLPQRGGVDVRGVVQIEDNLDSSLPNKRLHQSTERFGAVFRDPPSDIEDRDVTHTTFVDGHRPILASDQAVRGY